MADPVARVLLRLDPALLADIDARAMRARLSRNAWLQLALRRIVDMPVQVERGTDRKF